MDTFGQFFFLLVPGLIAAGGVAAVVLHRSTDRNSHGRRRRHVKPAR